MITDMALAAFEVTLNHYLHLDPEMPQKLNTFSGKVVHIQLKDIGMAFFIHFEGDQLKLATDSTQSADTTISGSTFGLMRLGMASKPEQQRTLFAGNVSIQGDMELGHAIKNTLDSLEIDWEEQLSLCVGDTIAHTVGQWAKGVVNWGDYSCQRMTAQVSEFLQEEARFMPPREELKDFFDDVDQMRLDADRTFARFDRVKEAFE